MYVCVNAHNHIQNRFSKRFLTGLMTCNVEMEPQCTNCFTAVELCLVHAIVEGGALLRLAACEAELLKLGKSKTKKCKGLLEIWLTQTPTDSCTYTYVL